MAAPPFTWLRAFEAAARHMSFTKAAEELGLTQSAISQQIRGLETMLGRPLFLRAHRRLYLTEAGRLMQPDVVAGVQHLFRATERFVPSDMRPQLRVAASASIVSHVIAPRLGAFRAAHPDVLVELQSTVWPDDFLAVTADVEIRFGTAAMAAPGSVLLEPSELIVVAQPGLAEDLPRIQPIGLSHGWSELEPGAVPDITVDTHGLAVDLALQGVGRALTHRLIANHALSGGMLERRDAPPRRAQEGYHLALTAGTVTEQAVQFRDWLLACLPS